MTRETPPPGFRELVRADALASNLGSRSPLFYVAAVLGLNKFSVVLLFRIAVAMRDKGRIGRVISGFVTRLNTLYNSSELSPLARIGPGLHVPHTMGVGFGAITAGRNLTILHQGSLGLRNRDVDHADPANYPTLGDNVQIGPGAVVLGPISIGDGATIGPNSVVLHDMPAGALAIGNPARIMHRQADVPPGG